MSSARIKKFVLTNSGNKLRKDDLIFVKRAADVEYRLARQTVIDYWKNGEIERENLCDAQPMLKLSLIHI